MKGFMHRRPDTVNLWASYPGLNIHTPSPRYIFAMKAEAARAETSDFEDLRALRRRLRLKTLDQAIAVVETYIPADRRVEARVLVSCLIPPSAWTLSGYASRQHQAG